jgi:hypothetical protein
MFGLFSAELDLLVTGLASAGTIYKVAEGNFLGIRSPRV